MTSEDKQLEWELLSSRTKQKIIRRAGIGCALCGWNEAPVDLHHIVEKQNGGLDVLSNLIPLCPNCHRCVHHGNDDFITEEEMKSKSLESFDWTAHYNPGKRWTGQTGEFSSREIECECCGKSATVRSPTARFCSSACYSKTVRKVVDRPSKEELIELIERHTWVDIGKQYGVSDNAVRKWAKAYGIGKVE